MTVPKQHYNPSNLKAQYNSTNKKAMYTQAHCDFCESKHGAIRLTLSGFADQLTDCTDCENPIPPGEHYYTKTFGVAAALNGQTYDLPLVLGSPTSCKWYLEVTKESGNYGYTEYYEDSSCETLDYTYYYTVMQIVVVLQSNSGFWIEIRLMSSGGITDVFAFTYSTWYLTGLCADMEDTFINDAEFECGEEELELHPCLESGSVAVVFL